MVIIMIIYDHYYYHYFYTEPIYGVLAVTRE